MDPNCKTQNTALDRLSSLPDDILIDILSLLPNKSTVSTSVLSTRWRLLWTHIDYINLDCRHFRQPTFYFYLAVCQLLLKLVPPSPRSLTLHVPYDGQQYFEVWLAYLCSQNNVEHINIDVEGRKYPFDDTPLSSFTMPCCIFQTKSLVSLDLSCYSLTYYLPTCDDDVVVTLPNLRKLSLHICASECGFFATLVRSCPLLEDLSLSTARRWDKEQGRNENGKGVVIDISCANLKHLYLDLSLDIKRKDKVVIDAPELVWFSLFAPWLNYCSFTRKPILLQEAEISASEQGLVLSLLPVIMNVRVLHLSGLAFDRFEGFTNDQHNSFIFRNLIELNLDWSIVKNFKCWDFIQFESTSSSLLLHVKKIKVEVYEFEYMEEWKMVMEYLLNNAPALVRLTFVAHPILRHVVEEVLKFKLQEMMFCMGLYSWSRNASQCLTEFHGHCVKLPANIAEVQELENQIRNMSAALIDDVSSS